MKDKVSVRSTLQKFENGAFTLKTHQMFSVHTKPEKLNATITRVVLDLCLRKPRAGKSHFYRDVIVLRKAPFSKCSPSSLECQAGVSNSSALKSVFEKLCFRDGLVWTVDLTVEIKLRFHINFSKVAWTDQSLAYLLMNSCSEDKVILCPRM